MPKRNDLCPCGSGKKYKKCCMNRSTNQAMVVQDELNQLETELLYMAFTRYQKQLTNWVQSYHSVYPEADKTVTETLSSMLLVWLIFTKPIQEDGTTIFDVFYEGKKRKLKRPKTAFLLETWKQTRPAVLEIKQQTDERVYKSVDLLTGQQIDHILPTEHEKTARPGSTVIGFPAKSDPHMSFIGPVISHLPEKTATIKQKVASFVNETEDAFLQKWPQLLSALLNSEQAPTVAPDQFRWHTDKQKETAEALLNGLRLDRCPPEIEMLALEKWNQFCQEHNPAIRKPAAYAAAMEYALQTIAPISATQKALAKKYGVSPSTISARSAEIVTVLKETATA
ncbi:hypothetical protein J26TS2_02100 [Shouchella clausii]|uniref:SEC-C domain-containing protein n=1 Tax=Shouchella tritolerans TaxID=2979466 RepID=UPI0007874207|nr:SEC-C domain-containing protein [Shouchella tritolerans]GIN10343.1 hypothetical protein J26TS2_02100 [Shouchella clausii]